ncbi:hypothetical protein [Kocuria salina]|nr:hypothetical protein [Kocuria salina]
MIEALAIMGALMGGPIHGMRSPSGTAANRSSTPRSVQVRWAIW